MRAAIPVFADGNKRTATQAALIFLADRGLLDEAPAAFRVRIVGELAVEPATGRLTVEELARWFKFVLAAPHR